MGETEDLAEATKKLKDAEAETEKWKALSRKNEDRAKENADAADRLKKLEESSLSDQQKREAADKTQADKLKELEDRANTADARALRAEVASDKKLTPGQAKRLTGTTREELEADADDLLENFKVKDEGGAGGNGRETTTIRDRPKERLRGGSEGTGGEDDNRSVADIVKSIPRI